MDAFELSQRKKQIEKRFHEERMFALETMWEERITPMGKFRLKCYYTSAMIREFNAMVLEIGGDIIAPYCADPRAKALEYIRLHKQMRQDGLAKGSFPNIHEFITWYCSSDVIRKELEEERPALKADLSST